MKKVDKALGDFLWQLWHRGLDKETNVVVVSDHGMSGYHNKTWGFIKDYINKTDVEFIGEAGPMNMILASKNGSLKEMYQSLKAWSGISVYKKEDVSKLKECRRIFKKHLLLFSRYLLTCTIKNTRTYWTSYSYQRGRTWL